MEILFKMWDSFICKEHTWTSKTERKGFLGDRVEAGDAYPEKDGHVVPLAAQGITRWGDTNGTQESQEKKERWPSVCPQYEVKWSREGSVTQGTYWKQSKWPCLMAPGTHKKKGHSTGLGITNGKTCLSASKFYTCDSQKYVSKSLKKTCNCLHGLGN